MAKNPFPKAPVRAVRAGGVRFGGGAPLALIAGPCVIESREMALDLAARLSALAKKDRIPFVFKASYDKANRTSVKAFRGPGLAQGLEILAEIKERFGMPILVDVHQTAEVKPAAEVADILQLPAFLCRQTDLAVALGESGRVVNIKKGQFLAPWDMRHVIEKVESTGNRKILLTERGASFGYNNLVADFRSLLIMRQFGYPVVFDATHSVQLPGGREDGTGGDGRWAPYLSRAAAAAGCDGLFWETHRNPPEAKSDKDNALPLAAIGPLWRQCRRMDELA
jgi:2-dehydro-3-deoxyphosphooctonate aldolase (KDO 8-P synthase)